jgi:hypothetical protein
MSATESRVIATATGQRPKEVGKSATRSSQGITVQLDGGDGTDREGTTGEQSVNVEVLKSIISSTVATPDEKDGAREKLRQIEPPAQIASEADESMNEVEQFLLAYRLDDLAERYLRDCGNKTFIGSSQAAGINGWWVNAEWENKPDRVALERKLKRLRALRKAALRVRDSWISVLHGKHRKRIDPVICELLGIDLSDPESGLSNAKRQYVSVATARVDETSWR